jgi:hypothetical protein
MFAFIGMQFDSTWASQNKLNKYINGHAAHIYLYMDKLLTVRSMHLISLSAPKHPKNASRHTSADVMTKTYTDPEKRFVPRSSLRKLRSTSVIKLITNTIAPPSCCEKRKKVHENRTKRGEERREVGKLV